MIIKVKHYVLKSNKTGNVYDRGYDVFYASGKAKTYNKHTVPKSVLDFISKHIGELKEYSFLDEEHRVYTYH
ncbi:MAG: hypothetical protein IK134_08515 [Oscillospiraceae bacterium]|nr:hypothetical protein [Oscillospiraceae bacterium]